MSILERLRQGPLRQRRSGVVAKERLKLILECDRAQLSPGELDLIKDDIIRSISRHVDVAASLVEVKLEAGGRLVAEIPLSRGRGRSAKADGRPAPDA